MHYVCVAHPGHALAACDYYIRLPAAAELICAPPRLSRCCVLAAFSWLSTSPRSCLGSWVPHSCTQVNLQCGCAGLQGHIPGRRRAHTAVRHGLSGQQPRRPDSIRVSASYTLHGHSGCRYWKCLQSLHVGQQCISWHNSNSSSLSLCLRRRLFLANPDLPKRFELDAPLNEVGGHQGLRLAFYAHGDISGLRS